MQPKVVFVAVAVADGCVAVMHFVTKQQRHGDEPGWERDATPEAIEAEVRRVIPGAVSWRVVNAADIPNDRTFRNAWRDTGKVVDHDLKKVQSICLDRLRATRGPQMEQHDRDWMKAMGRGDAAGASAAEAKRQALRDAPQALTEALKGATSVEGVLEVCARLGVSVRD